MKIYLFCSVVIINFATFFNQSCSEEKKSCSSGQTQDSNYQQDSFSLDNASLKDIDQSKNDEPQSKQEEPIKHDFSYIKYRDLFERKGDELEKYKASFEKDSNYTDYYDFSLDDEEVESLVEHKISFYPTAKFLNTNQGNYLHFLKVAYEKKLPVYFTTDIFIEGLTKSVNRMKKLFFEEVLIHYIKKFADSLTSFIANNKDKPKYKSIRFTLDSVQTYYSILSYLISNKIEAFSPRKDIEAEFNRWKKIVESYSLNEIFFMGKKKKVDYSYLTASGYWKTTQRLNNIWQATAFLTVHKFHVEEDIKGIWIMGKLVDDAELGDHFNKMSDMLTYFKGQNSILLNVVQISRLGAKKGFEDYVLSTEQFSQLSEIAKTERQKLSLKVLDQMILWSKDQVEAMKQKRELHTHFLNEDYTVIEWVINKVTDYREKSLRNIVSFMEVNQIITENRYRYPTIKSRMRGVKRTVYDRVMKLRDHMNFTEYLEAAENVISKSIVIEQEGWRENLNNHFYLLYNTANKNYTSRDKLYQSPVFKEKNYNLAPSNLVSLSQDIKVMSRYMGYTTVEGGIPEIWFESNMGFYDEVNVFLSRFEYLLGDFINHTEESMRVNFKYVRNRLSKSFEDLKYANNLIRRAIELQESNRLNEEVKTELREILFVEDISETWDGWLARLYDTDSQMTLFNFECYSMFINHSVENEKEGFNGANHFIYNKFNEIGVVIVKDKQENSDKLMLFSTSNWGESYNRVDDTQFNNIKEMVTQRLLFF